MTATQLHWLPEPKDWSTDLKACETAEMPWPALTKLANTRLDFLRTGKLDRLARKLLSEAPREAYGRVRLAVLSSSTVDHLLPGIRVAGLRRGLWIDTYLGEYGQYRQELLDPGSPLHEFKPDAVLFALDARHLTSRLSTLTDSQEIQAQLERSVDDICRLWRQAKDAFKCQILQQTALPVFPLLMGNNEFRLASSPNHLVERLNDALRARTDQEAVDLVAIHAQMAQDGMSAWHDPVLWNRAKQEVHPTAGPLYGDLVVRAIAAQRGRSFKCLALDLDNTLWGGVIGDDGLEGIQLGQGSAAGEAYVSFQRYVKALAARGVILAVCSKNDEEKALEPFEKHPEMVLRRQDIACFVANWQDKATNLRKIAATLNIGIDAIAFADDNPFERELVRRELPEVGVPELPEDPALYAYSLAAAGYFEALKVTAEDTQRTDLYRQNAARAALEAGATDLQGYLKSLDMRMLWRAFDRQGLQRIHQLINKTNQFNLTTERYTEAQVAELIDNPAAITLQIRLTDQFGDNGIIALVIGRRLDADTLYIDTWLMSCRVLGRQVEEATLRLLAQEAKARGVRHLIGEFRPTAKNAMVREHYPKLGFAADGEPAAPAGATRWRLALETFEPRDTFIQIEAVGG